ncbi:bifunctional diguanylate cyclase/phosphodiesterase [Massilia soli]|uniref:EAL domain-containing protein n=1 Tax=Massilia soli TaxID=2792854 RepID=A0ABS7SMJ6_9BURK|nr:EAL domain-containing protein [Massilia soli]MBZ2207383.1 EAL domain-containing protein [Massilia soli]
MFDLDLVFGTPDTSLLYAGQFDPLLVMLSVAIAVFAAYAALLAGTQPGVDTSMPRRAIWLFAGGLCLGLGTWGMHFVGMLAFALPTPTFYHGGLTLLSSIPGVLASTLAWHVIRRGPPSPRRLCGAGVLLGAGIAAMHHTGMAAMEFGGVIRYDLRLFLLSIVLAVGLSTLALWLRFHLVRPQARWRRGARALSALVLGLAVAGMHYAAMAASHFVRGKDNPGSALMVSPGELAAAVLVCTSLLLVVAIVATYLDKRRLFSLQRSSLPIGLLVAAWTAAAWFGAGYLQLRIEDADYQRERQLALEQAATTASFLEQTTIYLNGLSLMLARDADMTRVAQVHPPIRPDERAVTQARWQNDPALQRLNASLARAAASLHVDSMFVLNAAGDGIVTSDLANAAIHVGNNFANRDYYKLAIATGQGQQFGKSLDGTGALFFARSIVVDGRTIGIAIIKLNMARLASAVAPGQSWIADAAGVVIHATAPGMLLAAMPDAPLAAMSQEQRLQRYGRASFDTLRLAQWQTQAVNDVVTIGAQDMPQVLAKVGVPGKLKLVVYTPRPLPALLHHGARRFWLFLVIEFAGGVVIAAATATLLYLRQKRKADADLRVAATAFESHEGMAITDAANMVLQVNQAYLAITGFSESDLLGRPLSVCDPDSHDEAFMRSLWIAVATDGAWQGEVWQRRKDGTLFPSGMVITAVRDAAGQITQHVCAMTDITERKASEQEIRNLALYDFLTQLPNRRCLMERLAHALAASERAGQCGALLFIDLDNFKDLNDTLGHNVGDLLLQQVARRLVACVRENDTVARLGGDEFVIMLENLADDPRLAAEQAREIGEKLLARQGEPYIFGAYQHSCTSSIGISVFRGKQASVEDLLKQTDLAMYQAKANGRNTMCFFDPAMQAVVSARAALDGDLRLALAQRHFELHYQPQVDAEGRITGAEALLRWQHPQRGMVAPAEFIGAAESSGLIVPLGAWVLEQACARLVAWQQQPRLAQLSLSVNVSPRQFHQPDFVEQAMAALARSGADPRRLKLELTESLLLDDVEASIEKMSRLNAAGVGISLDDFGTGYSSLTYLKRLPIYQLKIDRSFVRDIVTSPADAAITRTILTLADSMGLSAMAEGVETEEQRHFLNRQGCRAYQGYLFGKPVTAQQFEQQLLDVASMAACPS